MEDVAEDVDIVDNDMPQTDQHSAFIGAANISDQDKWNTKDGMQYSKKVWKNLILLGIIMCLVVAAYGGLQDLQSSLFIAQGMGVVCQCIVYAVFALSSLLLPELMMTKFGHKWTLFGCFCGYVTWMAANGYATWVTMPTVSVIVGACAALAFTHQSSYTNILAVQYAKTKGGNVASTMATFFGINIGILKLGRLFGSVLSWAVLQTTWRNVTSVSDLDLQMCGANDCPWLNTTNVNYTKPPAHLIWTLVGIYIAFGVTAILLTAFALDPLPVTWYQSSARSGHVAKETIIRSVTSAARLHKNYKQLLVIPIFVHSGLLQCFITAEFNKSFVTCSLGIWMVGLVILPNPVFNTAASVITGQLARKFRNYPQLTAALLADVGIFLFCLWWRPSADHLVIYFVISALLGVTDGIEQAQISTIIGLHFPGDHASYSNFRLWQGIGYASAFLTNRLMCVRYKIMLMLCCVGVALICYTVLEFYKPSKKTVSIDDKS